MNGEKLWRLAQRLIALGALLTVSPALLAILLVVRSDSPGPAIFRAARVGRGGRLFTMHKVRTMRWDPRRPGTQITGDRDPRVTRVGRLLRRTRIDELPQLWDVARGQMLLVGPRPEAPDFVDLGDPRWAEIVSVTPGITGPTQLAYTDEGPLLTEADAGRAYLERILPLKMQSDLDYVRTRTWPGDIGYLVATLCLWRRQASDGRAEADK